jgi:hypothetical protein
VLSAEHCEFNFVAGLNRRKKAPLFRLQIRLAAEMNENLRASALCWWGRAIKI